MLHLVALSLAYATPPGSNATTVITKILVRANDSAPHLSAGDAFLSPDALGANGNNWPAKPLGAGECADQNGNPATEYICYQTGPGGSDTILSDCQALGAGQFNAFAMGFTFGTDICEDTYGARFPCCNFWVVGGAQLPSYANCQAFSHDGGRITQAVGKIGGTCYTALDPPEPPLPPGELPVCEKGWPTFSSSNDLDGSAWGDYFKDLYGSAPPASMFPLDTSTWWMFYDKLIASHNLQLPASAGKCAPANCQLNHYGRPRVERETFP